jgi:Fe-S cluster assembly protein SufB
MPETQDEILEEVVNSEYKYGFVTDIEADNAPIGLTEENSTLYFCKERRAGMDAGMAIKSFP